ncbi:hypothetical protein [Paenibacillus violae]|nr:hypothetical protein [Paenibacillus sp. PFR10]
MGAGTSGGRGGKTHPAKSAAKSAEIIDFPSNHAKSAAKLAFSTYFG